MTFRTLNYGNYGIFLIMGHAGFCPSTVPLIFRRLLGNPGKDPISASPASALGFRGLGFRVRYFDSRRCSTFDQKGGILPSSFNGVLIGGAWVVISGVISPLIRVTIIVPLLVTPLIRGGVLV